MLVQIQPCSSHALYLQKRMEPISCWMMPNCHLRLPSLLRANQQQEHHQNNGQVCVITVYSRMLSCIGYPHVYLSLLKKQFWQFKITSVSKEKHRIYYFISAGSQINMYYLHSTGLTQPKNKTPVKKLDEIFLVITRTEASLQFCLYFYLT